MESNFYIDVNGEENEIRNFKVKCGEKPKIHIHLITSRKLVEQRYDLTGCLVTVTIEQADKWLQEKLLTKEDAINGSVLWEFDNYDSEVLGKVKCTIKVYNGWDDMSLTPFYYTVVES